MFPTDCFVIESSERGDFARPRLAGYATTSNAVIFGTEGLEAFLKSGGSVKDIENGRFFAVLPERNKTIVKTDRTGQEQLFVFENGRNWAISNSFLLLAAHVAKSHPLTVYLPALIGFHLKGGRHVGEQLVSHKTAIRQIRMVPATHDLEIDQKTGGLTEVKRDFLSYFALDDAQYADTMIDFLEERAGLLAALATMGKPLNLLLSGGYDSRLVLALLLQSGSHENLHITSHPSKSADFASASAIVDHLGLSLNQHKRRTSARASPSDAMRLWLLSCGCTYLPVFRIGSFAKEPDFEFRLTGDQPTGWDHFDGDARFNGTAHKVANDIEIALANRPHGPDVARDFVGVLDTIGVEPDHPKAMLAHYWAVRSRHHCGRNWYKSQGSERLVTPLMDANMVRLDFYARTQGWSEKKFFADAYRALAPWTLGIPFETPDRAIPDDLLDSSPFRNGVQITPRSFRVYGTSATESPQLQSAMLDLPLKTKSSDAALKEQLVHNFWTADLARESGCFSESDFNTAHGEINDQNGTLPDCRKLAHIAMTEVVLEIIAGSRSAA